MSIFQKLQTAKFLVLDTETTGFGANDEVIQIGIIDQDENVVLETLFKPSIPIPKDASDVNGLTDEMCALAPLFSEYYEKIKQLVENNYVCIYNADYDIRMINQTARRYKLAPINFKYLCIMKAYSAHRNTKWTKLAKACEAEGVEFEGFHNATADTIATLRLIKNIK